MRFAGRTALVTGGGGGIGRAIVRALASEGVRVAVADLDAAAAEAAASECGGFGVACDVGDPADIAATVARTTDALGPIEILVSNAGFADGALTGPASAPDDQWQRSWDVHVMAHLRTSRLLLPEMVARQEGWLVNIASAAGLLTQIGDAPYSASKHAAVSLAQSLAIEHGDDGIRASVVCPLYVATPLLGYDGDRPADTPHDRVLSPETIARALLDGIREGRFLILPHAEAADHLRRRAGDTDRWVAGMRRLRRKAFDDGAPADIAALHRRI
jgi:NAD(P)-dependent dehydrogenase (short-subunit alcohol dehydrogenase family)